MTGRTMVQPEAASLTLSPAPSALLQRKCACGGTPGPTGECAECRKKRLGLQRKATSPAATPLVSPLVHEVLRSSGRPLDRGTRAFMEGRFGHDFGEVRVHTGEKAAESAADVNAHAYTVGRDVVFGAGRYAPGTTEGKRLLAHELAHTVQQETGARGVQTRLDVAGPDGPAEREASDAADRVVADLQVPAIRPVSGLAVQRQDDEPAGDRPEDRPAEPSMTRAEEVRLSRTSPGGLAGTAQPPMISLYNFAIDSAEPKPEHRRALDEVNRLLVRGASNSPHVSLVGHADETGGETHNERLSLRRATAVQGALRGASFQVFGLGERMPAAANDTAEGRSRNRRVDVHVRPASTGRPQPPEGTRPPEGTQPPERTTPPKGTTPPERTTPPDGPGPGGPEKQDDSWFCVEFPLICLAIGGGAVALWYCLSNPLRCLPGLPGLPGGGGSDTPDDGEKEKKPRRPRACPLVVNLPSGTLRPQGQGPVMGNQYWLLQPFDMKLLFMDTPDGCECGRGEYLQELRGFAERTDSAGNVTPERVRLVGGLLDRTTFREDAREGNPRLPYGHRDIPSPTGEGDEFLQDRATGCEYDGHDEPSMRGTTPGERMHFSFEFRGAPVDRDARDVPLEPWRTWTVEGDFTIPQPTPPTTPTTPTTPTPTPTPAPTTPLVESEDVWGFLVTQSMCRCEPGVREDIAWADEAGRTYRACDLPNYEKGAEVEECFKRKHPEATVEATTSPGGAVSLPERSSDPCRRVHQHAVRVHETFHVRQGDRIARSIGGEFFQEWNRLRGDPKRLETLRERFPRETTEYLQRWESAHDWAQSEIESYMWQRRFFTDVLRALQRICRQQ